MIHEIRGDVYPDNGNIFQLTMQDMAKQMFGISRADKVVNFRVSHSIISAAFIRPTVVLNFYESSVIVFHKNACDSTRVLCGYKCIIGTTVLLTTLITLIYDTQRDMTITLRIHNYCEIIIIIRNLNLISTILLIVIINIFLNK